VAVDLVSSKCMFIVSTDIRVHDKPVAMTPGQDETQKSGVKVYNTKFAEFNPADRAQKWWWDKEDNALHSYAPYDDHVLIERKGQLRII